MTNAVTNGQTQAIGRRKAAVARVRLFKGQGQITVNGRPIAEYFSGPVSQKHYQKPFVLTETLSHYTGTVKVLGGGLNSQLDAVILGIARALQGLDVKNRAVLKSAGFLKVDARVRERRKYGHAHSARSMKQSPKR